MSNLSTDFAPPAWFRPIEVTATLAFFAAVPGFVWYEGSIGASVSWLGIIGGYLAADLFSGLMHWACDRLGSEKTPIVGPSIIRAFREHHVDPLSITRHDFFEVNGSNALATLPLWALIVADAYGFLYLGSTGTQFLASLSIFTVLTNQIHCWAHLSDPPFFARMLQVSGLIISKKMHARHHTPPFETSYCITVGIWNRMLDPIRFWDRVERRLGRVSTLT